MRILLAILLGLCLVSCAEGLPESPQPQPTRSTVAVPTPEEVEATLLDEAAEEAKSVSPKGDFDFYVLALSWSPDFCETNNDPQQCKIGRKLGFVLHGLWPQYNKGYPSDCSNERMPQKVKDKFAGLYPSPKLYDHEWQKHGTCSGLTPDEYLTLSQQLKQNTIIPDAYQSPEKPVRVTTEEFKQDFVEANPTFTTDSLAVNCSGSGRFLKELFICFNQDGTATACSSEVKNQGNKSCRQPDFLVRNVR